MRGLLVDCNCNGPGWAVVFFCCVGGLIALATILPGGSGLKLAKEDFEVTRFFRRHLYNWQNTGEFLPYRISSRQSGVVFNDGSARAGIATRMNIALSGRNSYLPDTYGLSASDLVSLMTRWGERAMRRASTSIPN
jgi:hypothetical protein